jgi:hypothetical protein
MATAKQLAYVKEYKQHRRSTDQSFAESERLSNRKYSEFSRLARLFAKKFPQQFAEFIKEKTLSG